MDISKRKAKYYYLTFMKYDFRASITVFFVALPLCLGISLASGAPLFSGLIAGIIGGILVASLSGSQLSVSGPAAGLTAICAAAILELGNLEFFFLAVALAGIFQIILGVLKLGGFTHFIPSAVIKGMLAAIGILLIAKQLPFVFGYDQAFFWSKDFFNIFTFENAFSQMGTLYSKLSWGAMIISVFSLGVLIAWKKYIAKHLALIPTSFVMVILGSAAAFGLNYFFPAIALKPSQYVSIQADLFTNIHLPNPSAIVSNSLIFKTAIMICLVASIETLLSIEASDKIDPFHRTTPQNRELIAQGVGNFVSGLLGGLPITSVIVRSSANAEAGAHTKLSGIFHGIWLLLMILFATLFLNMIPYCVLAILLVRTGYNLAKPQMLKAVYKLGREQFFPFLFTIVSILLTDLLIGVIIGISYASYFIIKHTYRAGFISEKKMINDKETHYITLANNCSFINKKKIKDELNNLSDNSIIIIDGSHCVYIDYDIIEVINEFKSNAELKDIKLHLKNIPEIATLKAH